MAGNRSALTHTFTGSFIEFYQQTDDTVRIRVYLTPQSADYECIMSAANWATMILNVTGTGGTGGNYTRSTEEVGPMGADGTVNI